MKLFFFETYKILKSRFIIILILIMLCLNAVVYNLDISFPSPESSNYSRLLHADELSILYREYAKNPELIEKTTDLVADKIAKEEALTIQASKDRIIYIPSAPAVYFKNMDISTEGIIFKLFSNSLAYKEKFNKDIEEVIRMAKVHANRTADKSDTSGFVYEQQIRSIEKYQITSRIKIPVIYYDGTESFFTYGYVNLFLLLSVLLVCSHMFAVDSGMMTVMIRSAKKGRSSVFAAKICSAAVLNILLTFIFYTETLLCSFQRFGIPDLFVPIQSVPLFELCPYTITILGGIIIVFFIKCLIILAFSAFVLAFSVLRNQIITYAAGAAFIAVNYFLAFREYVDSMNPFKIYNLYSIANPYILLSRYSLLNVFNHAVPALAVVCVAALLISVLFTIVSAVIYRKNAVVYFKFPKIRMNALKMFRQRNVKATKLTQWEAYKLYINKKLIFLVVAIIAASLVYSLSVYRSVSSPMIQKYKEAMETLEGPVTDEKLAWINERISELSAEAGAREELKNQHDSGEITTKEYMEKLRLANIAETDLEVMTAVSEHAGYLLSLGENGVFLYDTGWNTLLSRKDNIFYLVCIVLLFSGIFADEYSCGFAPLLHTTKRGRKDTVIKKLIITVGSAAILFLILEACDFITILANFSLPQFSAPLACISDFSEASLSTTLFGAYFANLLLKFLISVALAAAVSALSYFTENKTAAITLSAVVCAGIYLL